ncbi:LysR family transcriptional regulator [Pollutimonas harenae]|uniref:LysR family transcriptional regulator n=1 Tax=Pollutimonas harenae TaxID=657015 RepID=A0A853GTT9_9BURK|nr:LysR substrate-binding domain-containing protein [Pollutimonas harenae]NYT86578.1 LysR family transcriptional regulator [Pollutimonas harenae]TEA69681.1 LysR family transcriptional regulator [Pollutimonas harenae]
MIQHLGGFTWARRLKVRHLESFLVLEEAGTLTRAAEQLHMTQSAMSHWLAELENIAGTTLVIRGRRLQLTPAGQLLKHLALGVLGDIARAGHEMHAVAAGRVPRLNVGSVWAGIAGGLPEAVSLFQQQYPDVAVAIHDGPFDNLLKGLETRAMDAVVGVLDARAHRPGLAHRVLFEDRVAIVMGQGSKYWQHSSTPSFGNLLHEQWIMPPSGTLTRIQMDAFLIEQGASWLRPRVETASLAMMQTLLQKGDYVGVCSDSMAAYMASLGLFRKISSDSNIRFGPITVMWNDEHATPTLMDFVGCLEHGASTLHLSVPGQEI